MATPRSIVFRVPPVAWMVMVRKFSLSFRPYCSMRPRDLHHLAAEADHQRAADIGVGGVAPLGALHHLEALALAGHAAAGALDEGHDAVDVRDSRRGCRSG